MLRIAFILSACFAVAAGAFTCGEVARIVGAPRGYVFIIDPVSSGNQLAPVYLEEGFYPIYIRSNLELSPRVMSGLRPQDFLENIPPDINAALLSGDKKRIEKAIQDLLPGLKAKALGENTPIFIVAGQEVGVTMAEQLAAKFRFEDYDPKAIKSHRSKPHMHQAVEKDGIQIIPFTTAHNSSEALNWIRKTLKGIENVGGVVVKTGIGHSGSQVIPCRTEAEVVVAVNSILAESGNTGIINRSVMIQPFVKGREFAVNSVSVLHEGKLHTVITEVWEYIKPAPPAYGYEILLSPEEIPPGLLEKHLGVKKALHYRRGPGHGEYFVIDEAALPVMESIGLKRENGGLVLLGEIGHRMYGAGDTDISGASTLYGQVRGTVDSHAHPERIVRRSQEWESTGVPYTLTHRAAVFNVNAPKSEKPLYAEDRVWDQLRREFGEKIFKMNIFTKDGMLLTETQHLGDSMAQIKIRVPIGPGDREEIQRIVDRISELRDEGAFWRVNP